MYSDTSITIAQNAMCSNSTSAFYVALQIAKQKKHRKLKNNNKGTNNNNNNEYNNNF